MTQYARTDDGVHIGYRVRGRGDHDLLIPSYGTCSVSSFDDEPHCARFLARLESFARLITFDMRGIGLSDPVDPPFAPEQQAADARAVLDAAGSERATYLAWFLWGPSALTLAVEHPERLHALVAVNTGARFSRAPDYPAGVPPEFLSRFRDEVVAIGLGTRADVHQVVTWHAPSVADDERFVRWWVEAGQKGASPATAGAVLDMFRDVDVRSLLPSITVPTVVIQRRDTAWIRPAVGYYLAEHIPGARLVDIPGADMTPFTENSDAVIGEIEEVVTGRRTAPDPDRVLATVLFTDI
ncbi:MAG TPA: alpha/beta hydrolase, partial [Acidimicrobiales bacterium]|nr:alpha/beta hydrolase [Acidimicrobiales bacterium]